LTGQIPDATQTGAPENTSALDFVPHVPVTLDEAPASPADRSADPREALEESVAKKVADERKRLYGDVPALVPDGLRPEDQPTPAQAAPPPPEPAPAAPAPQAGPPPVRLMVNGQATEVPGDARVVIKVDGVEQEVSVSEALQINQLQAAARKRLGEASAKNAEADRRLADLSRAAQAAPPQPAPAPAAPPVDRETLVADLIDAVTYADKDKAREAVNKLLAPAPTAVAQPGLSPEQVAGYVQQTMDARLHEQRVESALTDVTTTHREVFSDPRLSAAVAAETQRMMAEDLIEVGGDPNVVNSFSPEALGHWHAQFRQRGRGRAFEEIVKSAAQGIERDFVKKIPPAPPTTPLAARLDAKRGASAPPAPATARPSAAPPPVKRARDVIAEDAAQRVRR